MRSSITDMLVGFHLIAFLFSEYFTPEWQKNARDITREVVDAMREASYTDDSRETPGFV